MIQTIVLVGTLDGLDVPWAFHHTDHTAIPLGRGADFADLPRRIILADPAAVQIFLGMFDGFGQFHGLLIGHRHHFVGHAGGPFAADPGKARKLVHQIFQRFNVLRHDGLSP